MTPISLPECYEECRLLNKHYASPSTQAITLFPPPVQPHLQALWGYARVVQRLARHPKDGVSQHKQIAALRSWHEAFRRGWRAEWPGNPYLAAMVHTAKMHQMPKAHFSLLIKSASRDVRKKRYATPAQLQGYLADWSGTLGKLQAALWEKSGRRFQQSLIQLNKAAQLTEILRQVADDFWLRDKIYLPQSDFARFGYSLIHLQAGQVNEPWRQLLERYITRAEQDFWEVHQNLAAMPSSAHRGVLAISNGYLDLLQGMRGADYDVFARRPAFSWKQKIRCAWPF